MVAISSRRTPVSGPSFAEFYLSSAYAKFPQEHRAHAPTGLKAFVVDQQAHDFTDAASADWVLGVPMRASCPTRFDYGDGWRKQRRGRGDFLLVPPGTEVRYEIAGPTKLLVVTWAEGRLAALDPEIFADEEASLRALTGQYFRNTAVESVCRSIWHEMARHDAASRLMLDSALTQLAACLLRCASLQHERLSFRRAEIRRVVAFIEENLRQDIALQDLAGIAGLSVFHFAREFRAQVGDAPYQYLQKRRAARAEELFARRHASAEDVALLSGFGSVRCMRTTLRRLGARAGDRPMPEAGA